MITGERLREILDDGAGGVGDNYIDVVVNWDEFAKEVNAAYEESD